MIEEKSVFLQKIRLIPDTEIDNGWFMNKIIVFIEFSSSLDFLQLELIV